MRHLRRAGFTLIEILIGTAILAFAMIPVFGLMTTGVVNTDTNVGYTNAVEIASGVMNHLLSEDFPFATLPLSGAVSAYPERGTTTEAEVEGNVSGDPALDPIFPAPAWEVSDQETRTISKNGIHYHVMIWIQAYAADGDLQFGHFLNPELDFRLGGNPVEFELVETLEQADFTNGFSPWSATSVGPDPEDVFPAVPASRVTSRPWTRVEASLAQDQLSETPSGAHRNFAKVLVRVSWGEDLRRGRGRAKDFWLVSFKADLQE